MFHPEVVAHARRREAASRTSCTRSPGCKGDWTMAAFRAEADRPIRDAGRQGAGDLRPLGRRRFGGRGGADPRGDRRPADLRLRRSRPAAAGRGGGGRRRCSAATTTSRSSMSTRRTTFSARSKGVDDPETKRKTIGRLFIDVFEAEARRIASDGKGAGRVSRARHALSRRDRERVVHRRPVGHDQEPSQCRRPARADEA